MISPKFGIYTKGQKVIIKLLDIIQIVFGLLVIMLIIWAMLVTQNTINIWTIIMGIAAIISLMDIVMRKVFNKRSFLHQCIYKIYNSKNTLFAKTAVQAETCSWIELQLQKRNAILLYGDPNTGKSSSVFMFLSQNTKDRELLHNINWAENIRYIDCKNSKSDIINFFGVKGEFVNKDLRNGSLIIIDNIETMGESFSKNLLATVKQSLNLFILLLDANNIDKELENKIEAKCLRNSFTLSLNENRYMEFQENYDKLTDSKKEVLLAIYYVSLSFTLIHVKDILSLFVEDYSNFRFKLIISSLVRKGFLKYFPFEHKYVLMTKQIQMNRHQCTVMDTTQHLHAVYRIIYHSKKFPVSAWISLISLSCEQIKLISPGEKERLFTEALNSGNYITLYQALLSELNYSPNKEELFLYELGTLHFYNSRQEKAYENYNALICKESSTINKNRIMLRIIETTHGDVTLTTNNNITRYLRELRYAGSEYILYAEYWALHIKTERGEFVLDKFDKLLKDFHNCKDLIHDKEIYSELVKRCYTDIIRSYHILSQKIPDILLSDFMIYLRETFPESNAMHQYYNALYVKANTFHYVELLDNILDGKHCHNTYDEAKKWYCYAIESGYENLKSFRACELKNIDLMLFDVDNILKFQDYELKIKEFLSNAEINRVSVHVAYCKTLLAKLYIIRNLCDDEYRKDAKKTKDSVINTYFRDARKLYKEYQNVYGLIRIDVIELLFQIATTSNKNEVEYAVKKMSDILEKHQEYQREINIAYYLKDIINRNSSYGMIVLSIIKAYPIIMQ